jgi:microcystin-dependent protein
VGDNVSTFNIPDMRGRAAFGSNGSPYWTAGPGEVAGSADSTLPQHAHTGVDHLHGVGIASGGANAQHNHNMPLGTLIRRNPFSPAYYLATTGASGLGADEINSDGTASGVNNQDHAHGVNGATGAADRNLNTGAAGGSASGTNFPPGVSFNFIMKVL